MTAAALLFLLIVGAVVAGLLWAQGVRPEPVAEVAWRLLLCSTASLLVAMWQTWPLEVVVAFGLGVVVALVLVVAAVVLAVPVIVQEARDR